ncbi:MAG: calcium/sodium antiporter [Proteobacteria bacterium]|nr:MAG: calcium/sodium antiporter [Pseudomonadota bacterium]
MLLSLCALVVGLALLVWSADRFIDGAAASARHFGMPPLLIGMLVVGFGTSLPEMVVSAIAAWQDNPGLALGNAYGSNITNIALILGVTALVAPIAVNSSIIRKELPLLMFISVMSGLLLWDDRLTWLEGCLLLAGFFGLIAWSIFSAIRSHDDPLEQEMQAELAEHPDMSLKIAMLWTLAGLFLLVVSSRLLVWGAVSIAQSLGVSDLIIGLTIVALGTSLPELASSVVAARKGEHDIALGNIIGSNMFNLLAVVGIAAVISPTNISPELLSRDWLMMMVLTLLLFAMCYGFRAKGRINRWEGALLLLAYLGYTGWLVYSALS